MDINKMEVKVEAFKNDYVAIIAEKENALDEALKLLDERVEKEIELLKPALIEKVKELINGEIETEYGAKIQLYEKYLEEKVECEIQDCENADICAIYSETQVDCAEIKDVAPNESENVVPEATVNDTTNIINI